MTTKIRFAKYAGGHPEWPEPVNGMFSTLRLDDLDLAFGQHVVPWSRVRSLVADEQHGYGAWAVVPLTVVLDSGSLRFDVTNTTTGKLYAKLAPWIAQLV